MFKNLFGEGLVWTLPTFALTLLVLVACAKKTVANPAEDAQPPTAQPPTAQLFSLSSSAIQEGGNIDAKFTCEGADTSPPLAWTAPPAGTRQLVLICDDPDAPSGTFTHWMFFGLSADLRALPEGVSKSANAATLGRQGKNDFDQLGYRGPCPPPGNPHHYRFRLYALDAVLTLPAGATRAQLDSAMAGHSLAEARLTALFRR